MRRFSLYREAANRHAFPTYKMSIRDRFGRSNTERRRSRAESNTHRAPDEMVISSEPDMSCLVRSENHQERPASVLSGKTTATRRSRFRGRSQRSMSQPKDPRSGTYEPPPFFQAYSQAKKDGILEVPSMTVEALYRAKCKIPAGNGAHSDVAGADRNGMDAKRGSGLRRATFGSDAGSDLPRKIFILATAGYLLQYAEKGLTDRLPEKVLHLSKESAAFACDLVPGKHYVLQVSQAVNRDGVAVEATSSGSFLSKLGIRSAATKRVAPNLILVLPNAAEMESWLAALRQEIEAVGGKKIKHHTAKLGVREGDRSESRQASKRYQLDPRTADSSEIPEMPSLKLTSPGNPLIFPDLEADEPSRSTMDEIELEAILLNNSADLDSNRTQSNLHHPDDPSASNTAEKSAPFSTSAKPTSQGPAHSPSEQSYTLPIEQLVGSSVGEKALPDCPPETPPSAFTSDLSQLNKPLQIGVSSLDATLHKPSRKPPPPPLVFSPYSRLSKRPIIEESPIVPNYPSLSPVVAVKLSHAYAERDYHISMAGEWPIRHRHDSKLDSPPSPTKIVVRDDASRDLPTATALKGLGSPTVVKPPVHESISSVQESDRSGSAALPSLPLQAIVSATDNISSHGHIRRLSPPSKTDPIAAASFESMSEDGSQPSTHAPARPSRSPSPPTYTHSKAPSSTQNAGLSLFPPTVTASVLSSTTALKGHPVANSAQVYTQPLRTTELSRRLSGQAVSAKQPPYLSSAFTASNPPDLLATGATVPIRTTKPQRSASNVAALANQYQFPTSNKPNALPLRMPTAYEEADLAKPLPQCPSTSLTKRTASRNSVRKSFRGLDHLPDLDFGIPIALLGPPAPPPSAPLPAPPADSRPTSPALLNQVSGSMTAVAGLGISVS